jgi:hypothetical protein
MRKNNFSNGAGAITDRTLEKQAFLIIPEGVAEVIFAHRLKSPPQQNLWVRFCSA